MLAHPFACLLIHTFLMRGFMHVCVVAFQLACFVCFICTCSTCGTHLVGADPWRVPLLGRSAASPAPALDVSVAPASLSVQVRLAPVPSARHPRIDPSARTPLDVGLLGLAPSDRPLSAQSLNTLLCLLSRSRVWHSTLGLFISCAMITESFIYFTDCFIVSALSC